MSERRPAFGIKSERTETGIVWHVMAGWRDDLSAFATWARLLSSHTAYETARAALRAVQRV